MTAGTGTRAEKERGSFLWPRRSPDELSCERAPGGLRAKGDGGARRNRAATRSVGAAARWPGRGRRHSALSRCEGTRDDPGQSTIPIDRDGRPLPPRPVGQRPRARRGVGELEEVSLQYKGSTVRRGRASMILGWPEGERASPAWARRAPSSGVLLSPGRRGGRRPDRAEPSLLGGSCAWLARPRPESVGQSVGWLRYLSLNHLQGDDEGHPSHAMWSASAGAGGSDTVPQRESGNAGGLNDVSAGQVGTGQALERKERLATTISTSTTTQLQLLHLPIIHCH